MKINRRVADAWLREVRSGWGERASRAAADVVEMVNRGQAGELHELGVNLAQRGHQLDEVLAWCRLLASHSRSFRAVLTDGGAVALASGWAEGVLRNDFAVSSVASLDVLRLQIQQQFELTASRGEAPDRVLALVVIATAGRHECLQRVEHHAREIFEAGDTMSATPNGSLLVLVRRTPEVRVRTLLLIDRLRRDDQLRGTPVRVWIEPLANTAEHLDSHLIGLAS